MNETFSRASLKMDIYWMGVALVWCLPRPFSQNTAFSKKALKPTFFFFISGTNFIGLFSGTSFVFIISVVFETQKEMFQLYHLNWPPLYYHNNNNNWLSILWLDNYFYLKEYNWLSTPISIKTLFCHNTSLVALSKVRPSK